MFTDFRYQTAAHDFSRKNPQWRLHIIGERSFNFLCPFLTRQSRLGVQSDRISVETHTQIGNECSGIHIIPVPGEISRIGIPKFRDEIKSISRAARIADRAYGRIRAQLIPGVTEIEIARKLDSLCSAMGSEGPSFPTVVLFGKRSALPHGIASHKRLKSGEIVLCDFGCTVHGFASDMTRTCIIGEPSEVQRRIYNIVYTAQQRARRAVRAGVDAAQIDTIARDYIEQKGYGEYFRHATGHGVGLRVHELPRIGARSKEKLRDSSVITVEPGIYLPWIGGVRIEDMVLVGERRSRIITHSARNMR
jgi:Xaa-Pro aminopeptidase